MTRRWVALPTGLLSLFPLAPGEAYVCRFATGSWAKTIMASEGWLLGVVPMERSRGVAPVFGDSHEAGRSKAGLVWLVSVGSSSTRDQHALGVFRGRPCKPTAHARLVALIVRLGAGLGAVKWISGRRLREQCMMPRRFHPGYVTGKQALLTKGRGDKFTSVFSHVWAARVPWSPCSTMKLSAGFRFRALAASPFLTASACTRRGGRVRGGHKCPWFPCVAMGRGRTTARAWPIGSVKFVITVPRPRALHEASWCVWARWPRPRSSERVHRC